MQKTLSDSEMRRGWSYLAIGFVVILITSAVFAPWVNATAGDVEPPAGDPVEQVIVQPVAEPQPTTAPAPTVILVPTAVPQPVEIVIPEPVVDEPDPVTEPAPQPIVEEPAPVVEIEPTVEPTAEPTPEPTVEPTAEPTLEPTVDPTAEPTPEPTVEPTPEPTPVVAWSQTNPVSCALRDGQPAGLAYNESRTYRCEVTANVTSDLAMPDDMQIEWTLNVDFPDSYVLQFPQGSPASVTKQLPAGTSTTYTIAHPWQQGSAQTLTFDLVVTRTTCAVGEQVLSVQANPQIKTADSQAEIKRQDGNVHPKLAMLTSPVIQSEAPSVAFDGPITFDALSATSSGLESEISRGAATIVVTGEWDPCTTWTVNLGGTVDVPAETPAQLRAVSINNDLISGDACDLSAPCDVIVLPETGSAATPLRYTIGLELQLHEFTPVGNFSIGIKSDIQGEGTLP